MARWKSGASGSDVSLEGQMELGTYGTEEPN